jgi:hypothetical protein
MTGAGTELAPVHLKAATASGAALLSVPLNVALGENPWPINITFISWFA